MFLFDSSSLIKRTWSGKMDGEGDGYLRWHQSVVLFDFNSISKPKAGSTILVGFACDEGVRRNQGRVGAKNGPIHIRNAMSNMAIHPTNKTILYDAGDIVCENEDLETAQEKLQNVVTSIHKMGSKSLLLGGGHELLYPHFMGLKNYYKSKKIGIINFDAHFDIRKVNPDIGPTSGTGFYQIATEIDDFKYLAIGIQEYANTQVLFKTAKEFGVEYISVQQFRPENKSRMIDQIGNFINSCDYILLTICMDVFASAFAPGVSASNYNGLNPDYLFDEILTFILTQNKIIGLDIAEVNPLLDIDERTSKLAASILYTILQRH